MPNDSLLGRLADEFIGKARQGKLPDIETYVAKHPELAERIRELFPTFLLLEEMATKGDSTPSEPLNRSGLSQGSIFGQYRIELDIGLLCTITDNAELKYEKPFTDILSGNKNQSITDRSYF